jgi:YesN/AraC family two-component response regulator
VVEKIINYIDNNYNDPDMSLKKIADIFAYTDKYLSHLFKESMQMNFTQYLTRLRVQKALDLIGGGLRDTDEIALQCGYRDTVYFSKVFKKIMCSTPNAYIKQKYQK